MATLAEIRFGIKEVLQEAIEGMHVYDDVMDVVQSPACVVQPDPKQTAEFDQAMARGHDKWYINVYILVARNDTKSAQQKLDALVSGAGDRSVREALWNEDLGLPGTVCSTMGLSGYGGSFDVAATNYVGAVLRLCVITPGTA